MAVVPEQVEKIIESETATLKTIDHGVRVEIARVRSALEEVEKALDAGSAVAASASGETLVASAVRVLAFEIEGRESLLRTVKTLRRLVPKEGS